MSARLIQALLGMTVDIQLRFNIRTFGRDAVWLSVCTRKANIKLSSLGHFWRSTDVQDRLKISPPPALKVCRHLKWVSCQKVLGHFIYLTVYHLSTSASLSMYLCTFLI